LLAQPESWQIIRCYENNSLGEKYPSPAPPVVEAVDSARL